MDGQEMMVVDGVAVPCKMLNTEAETPEVILEKARHAAVLLKDIVDKKKDPVKMNGEVYFEIEDWETLGNFYGLAPKTISSNFVQFGNVVGFEAKAGAYDKKTGKEITTADAMCLNDEEKWSARTKYEYHYVKKSGGTSKDDPGMDELIWEDNPEKPGKKRPKKEKVNAGAVAVPMFQLRSMAQTRAAAKALRFALGWVVVLAGYKATPAEELDGMTDRDTGKPASGQPEGKSPANGNGKAPAGATAPVRKSIKGRVVSKQDPKGNSPFAKYLMDTSPDKAYLETKDAKLIERMDAHGAAKEIVTVEYDESVNGPYTNRYIALTTVDPKDNPKAK